MHMLKRIFWKCETKVKENLYNQIVRSKLEYACTVWDPYLIGDQRKLEKVQKRSLKYVYGLNVDNYCEFIRCNNIMSLHHRRMYF